MTQKLFAIQHWYYYRTKLYAHSYNLLMQKYGFPKCIIILDFAASHIHTVQLNLNLTHVCWYTHVSERFPHAKLWSLACKHTVACNFAVRVVASEHMWHMSDAYHELALDLPHCIRMWCTGTVDAYRQWNALVMQLGKF